MRTKEELENLINSSPLFAIDRIIDAELFAATEGQFLNDLAKLLSLTLKDFSEIGYEIIQTAKACIKAYKVENGAFLNYFNTALKRALAIARAKERADNARGGLTIDEKTKRTIRQILRLARVRGESVDSEAFQKKVAEALSLSLESVREAIAINEGTRVISGNSIVKNKDGEQTELFSFIEAKEPNAEQSYIEDEIVKEKIIAINSIFNSQRDISKGILSKLLTARLVELFFEFDLIEWVVEKTSFIDPDILKAFLKRKEVPTAREIANISEIHEASASRTLNNFLDKLRGSCYIYEDTSKKVALPKDGKFNVINFHITEKCNYKCRFCFAQFMCREEVNLSGAKKIVDNIAEYFKSKEIKNGRINIAGGEPMLINFLDTLIDYITTKGISVSIISNGSMLSAERVRRIKGKVSMLGLSIDSLNHNTNLNIGRSCKGKTISKGEILEIIAAARECGIKVKVNTVVSKLNVNEDLRELYDMGSIDRIKLLQMRVNEGVNDIASQWLLTKQEFENYCKRLSNYNTVEEDDDALNASYIIINPEGNLLTNKGNKHTVVGSLFKTPLGELIEGNFNCDEFAKRYKEKIVRVKL